MSVKEIGQALLLVAVLLAVAGIVEPSPLSSAAVSVFVGVGFIIWVFKCHEEWRDGYNQGRYELSVSRLNASQESTARTRVSNGETLFKCGMAGCYCATDPQFREYAHD